MRLCLNKASPYARLVRVVAHEKKPTASVPKTSRRVVWCACASASAGRRDLAGSPDARMKRGLSRYCSYSLEPDDSKHRSRY